MNIRRFLPIASAAMAASLTLGCGGGSHDGSPNVPPVETTDAGPADSGPDDPDASPGLQTLPGYLKSTVMTSYVYTSNFGSPYDSILGAPIQGLQSAIAPDYKTTSVAGQLIGQQIFKEIDTDEDLVQALNVSASLSVSTGAFSASSKTSYSQSHHLNSSSLYIFLDATLSGQTAQIENVSLTPAAQAMSAADFYNSFGDRYASQIVTGIELYGMIGIQTTSIEDKQSLAEQLGVSYGPANASVSFQQTFDKATTDRMVSSDFNTIGFKLTTPITDADSLIAAVSTFASAFGNTAPDPNDQTLALYYTSYYGLPGYPGVPAATPNLVTAHAQAVSDYMLYDSLVTNDLAAYFADPNYAKLPFLTGMQTYVDGLSSFLTASLANSQGPAARPAIDPASKIESFANVRVTQNAGPPSFAVHQLANGFVPKRLSDYEIPLRYSHGSSLNGTSYPAVQAIAPSTDVTQHVPLDYQLYLVDRTTAPNPTHRIASYLWGGATYFLDGVADSTGNLDTSLVAAALNALDMNDYGHPELGHTQFVVVNRASGYVMTIDPGTYQLYQAPFSSSANQIWQFRVSGCGGGTSYAPGEVVYAESVGSPNWWSVGGYAPGPVVLGNYGWDCGDDETYWLKAQGSGDLQQIAGYGSSGWGSVQVDPGTGNSAWTNDGDGAQVAAFTGDDEQLWKFIPLENVDPMP